MYIFILICPFINTIQVLYDEEIHVSSFVILYKHKHKYYRNISCIGTRILVIFFFMQ